MQEQSTNKNVSLNEQDNIASDLLNMLKKSSGVKDLCAADFDGLMQELLIYIVNRDIRVFKHAYDKGVQSVRDIDNSSISNINVGARSKEPHAIL